VASILPRARNIVASDRGDAAARLADGDRVGFFPTLSTPVYWKSSSLIQRIDDAIVVRKELTMIDGLKVTLTGEELRTLLQKRAAERRASAARWQSEEERTPESATEDSPLLPDHMCENEAQRLEWRAEVLTFLRDHLDPSEIYRLDISDLESAELLPPKPDWLLQDEFEESTRVNSKSQLGWASVWNRSQNVSATDRRSLRS
jgi:hypothetical protein